MLVGVLVPKALAAAEEEETFKATAGIFKAAAAAANFFFLDIRLDSLGVVVDGVSIVVVEGSV